MEQEIKHLIQRIKGHHLPVRIEDMIPKSNAYDRDLQKLLDLLCYSYDMDLKIKIFSILAAYLLSKEVNCKTVVTHLPVYDEIQNVFRKGLTLSNTSVLYFVSALLSFDVHNGSQEGSLVIFAQNALRVSGCLATMANFFTRDMMYQDSWIALCRSVAEACQESDLNQSYCSYLVPVCVRKCLQGNMEACLVLQSLLHNDRNVKIFLDYNGTSIFSRKILQYDMCLQLLDTLVQRSQKAARILLETDVVYDLREYLDLYGPETKIGQWSTIILYHINSWSKNDTIKDNKDAMETGIEKPETETTDRHVADGSVVRAQDATGSKNITRRINKNDLTSQTHNPDDTKQLLQNIVREMAYWNIGKGKKINTTKKDQARYDLTKTIDDRKNNDDTGVLLQNIAGEIAYGKLLQAKKTGIASDHTGHLQMTKNVQKTQKAEPAQNRYLNTLMSQNSNIAGQHKMAASAENRNTVCNDLSFSFLLKQNNYMKRTNVHGACTDQGSFVAKPNLTTRQFSQSFRDKNQKRTNHTRVESLISITDYQHSREDEPSRGINLHRFKPSFTSTPKLRIETMGSTKTSQRSRSSTRISQLSRASFKKSKALATKRRPWNHPSRLEETNKSIVTSIKKRQSMSARLLTAINESCTTFVKSVKGIFKGSTSPSENKPTTDTKREMNTSMCSFSFTNYMRKRDAIPGNNGTKYTATGYDDSMDVNNEMRSCKTCDETALLKQKLANDKHLKETVKKLKYGINLYGCDFKKISKSLWPNDNVMTDRVLYQLYRKLLEK